MAVFISADQLGARIELLPYQVLHPVVRVGNDDFGRTTLHGTLDGSVRVGGHPGASAFVVIALGGARRPAGRGLTARGYP